MSRSRIGILSIILISLGVYVYFYELGPVEKGEESPAVEKVFDFKPEDIQEIMLKKKAEVILFRMEDGHWRIKKPLESNADYGKVYDLLSVFDYGIVRIIDIGHSNLSQYGLDRPEIEFGIKAKGHDTFQTLLIGGNSPGAFSCYGRVKGESGVLILGIRYKIELDRELPYFITILTDPMLRAR